MIDGGAASRACAVGFRSDVPPSECCCGGCCIGEWLLDLQMLLVDYCQELVTFKGQSLHYWLAFGFLDHRIFANLEESKNINLLDNPSRLTSASDWGHSDLWYSMILWQIFVNGCLKGYKVFHIIMTRTRLATRWARRAPEPRRRSESESFPRKSCPAARWRVHPHPRQSRSRAQQPE